MLSCINQMLGQRKRREGELTYSVYIDCIIVNFNPRRAVERKGEERKERKGEGRGGDQISRNTVLNTG